MTLQSPVLTARDEGERFHFLNTLQTAKITGEQTNDTLTAVEFLAPKNFGPPLHRHDAEDELFYILDGELWLSCGDVEGRARRRCGGLVATLSAPHVSRSAPRRHGCSSSRRRRDTNDLLPHWVNRPTAGPCPIQETSIPRGSRRCALSSTSRCWARLLRPSVSGSPAPRRPPSS